MIRAIGQLLLLVVHLAGSLPEVREQAAPDSIVYYVSPGSRLVVKTGRSGLFGFAGHNHVIRARAVAGRLVYRETTRGSYLRLNLPTDSLEVLTPPDTAEIRKVTAAMRTTVLHVDKYPQMTFAADSRPIRVMADVTIGPDTVRAMGTFTAKQTDFGIKPFSGGPGGAVKVADPVKFCFDLVAVRSASQTSGAQSEKVIGDWTTVPGCVDKVESAPAPF
jgi:hypothetical protein